MTLFHQTGLPGFRFAICLGWIIGVIFTRNPLKFTELKSWKMPYAGFAIVLNICMAIYATDFMFNIVPESILERERSKRNLNPIASALAHGFIAINAAILALLRIYFMWKAKEISSFLKAIQDRGRDFRSSGRNLFSRRQTGILSFVNLMLQTLISVVFAVTLLGLEKSHSWFRSLGTYTYSITVLLFIIWPCFLTHEVTFTLMATTLDRILVIFEGFCDYAECVAVGHRDIPTKTVLPTRTLNIQVQPAMQSYSIFNQQAQAVYLLQRFRAVQYLFLTYNKLMGPLVLVAVITSTVGAIDSTKGLLTPNDNALHVSRWWAHFLYFASHCISLTVLDSGHRARNLVKLVC